MTTFAVHPVIAAPVAPEIIISITPTELIPAQAGYVYVGGAYPLDVTITLDDEPLYVFWSGEGYMAHFAFGFDEEPGEHALNIIAENPATGERVERKETITVINFHYPREYVALPFVLVPLLDPELNESELAHLDAIYAESAALPTWQWPFRIPVPGGIVTSRFGGDRSYNGGILHGRHTGMDFRRHIGDPIYAAAAGRVAAVELLDVRGSVIIIDHGFGVFSQYSHLSETLVQRGDFVTQGQLIGAAGGTGRINGPHLHWEIIINGLPIDPQRWLALEPGFVPLREAQPDEAGS